jgi:hypothetical protein
VFLVLAVAGVLLYYAALLCLPAPVLDAWGPGGCEIESGWFAVLSILAGFSIALGVLNPRVLRPRSSDEATTLDWVEPEESLTPGEDLILQPPPPRPPSP